MNKSQNFKEMVFDNIIGNFSTKSKIFHPKFIHFPLIKTELKAN